MSFRLFRRVSRKSQRRRGGRQSRRCARIRGVELLEPRLTLDGFGVVGCALEPVAGENPSSPVEFTWQPYRIPGDGRTTPIPTDIAVGDFNGDGRLDLAFPLANRDVVSLLIGDDAGGFVEPQIDISLAPHAAGPIALVAGRFNGNGSLDVAVANSLTGNVSVLLDFDGTAFASIQHIWTGLSPRALAAGDLDRDGDLDLVVADEWTGRISILSNHGQGTFSVIKPPVQVAAAPFAVVAAQLNDDNGDGRIDEADHLDVAVACFGSDPDPSDPGGVWILRNDGNGTLTVTERHVAGLRTVESCCRGSGP